MAVPNLGGFDEGPVEVVDDERVGHRSSSRSGGATPGVGSSCSASAASRRRRRRATAKTISPITTTMASSATCIAGPGWSANNAVAVTRAPLASVDSCDVAAEGCEPAGGGSGGGVSDEQEAGETDRELVFVARE